MARRGDGARTGAVGYNTLFCAVLFIFGCSLSAGREQGRALAAGRPRAAFAAHCAAVARRREQLPAALAAAPLRAGRVCQQRAHGPGPSRPGPSRALPAGSRPHTPARGHAEGLFPPSIAPGTRGSPGGSRCRPGRRGWSWSRCPGGVRCPLSRAARFSRRFTAGDLLLGLTFFPPSGVMNVAI